MRVRTLLIVTALLSSILGAIAAYLFLTIPNDLQAAALMKTARNQIAIGDNDRARQSLSRIVQQYPRTDAAAAATVALASIAENERHKLAVELTALRNQSAAQQKQLAALGQRIDEIAARPIPQPVIIQAAPKKAKKTTTKRHTASRRRR
jgi:predicted  nucleic acid-binding Zn-ribbon protein